MRRTILLGVFALLVASAAQHAFAQRHGGMGPGFARSGHTFNRARSASSYGSAYLPYDSGYAPYDFDAAYTQPVLYAQQPPPFAQPPAPVAAPEVHPVVTEYNWPAADAASSSASEPQAFTLVLKDGSTLSALMVFASDDGLHYVDPDDRHFCISMNEVDRAATLKLNRARNLDLHLPAAQ